MRQPDDTVKAHRSQLPEPKPMSSGSSSSMPKQAQLVQRFSAAARSFFDCAQRLLDSAARQLSQLSIEAYRWVGGCYFLLLGLTTLILPQGSLSPKVELVGYRGTVYLIAGLSVLWLNLLPLSRRAMLWIVGVIALGLFGIVAAYLRVGVYSSAGVIFFFTCGLFLLPFSSSASSMRTRRPDALGLILRISIGDPRWRFSRPAIGRERSPRRVRSSLQLLSARSSSAVV